MSDLIERRAVCSCCGQPVVSDVEGAIVRRRITGIAARMLRILEKAGPLDAAALAGRVYGGRPDGGPEGALTSIHVYVSRLRKTLRSEGLTVAWRAGEGYRIEIVPTEAQDRAA